MILINKFIIQKIIIHTIKVLMSFYLWYKIRQDPVKKILNIRKIPGYIVFLKVQLVLLQKKKKIFVYIRKKKIVN